jgi:hypothetical protein
MNDKLKKFDNIDYYSKAYIKSIAAEGDGDITPGHGEDLEGFDLSGVFPGLGAPDLEGEPDNNEAVRDWLLRRKNTLYPNEIRTKMEMEMPIEVDNPFTDPVEDVSDPFYPKGKEGNPNTEDISEPIVYDPFEPEPVEQQGPESEIDATQELGVPGGENTASYQCLNSSGNAFNDPETGGPISNSERCGELGGSWTQDDFNINEETPAEGRILSNKELNDRPDSHFLYVRPSCGGKDGEGKTKPRSCRMFPYRNKKGTINLPHLRNALARIPQARSISKQVRDNLTRKAQAILEKEKAKKSRGK